MSPEVALVEDEIIRHSSGPMINEPDGIIPMSDDTVKVLRIQRNDGATGHRYGEMLAGAVQLFNAADVIGKIQKGAEFVVQVPAQYQAELQASALEMMHGSK